MLTIVNLKHLNKFVKYHHFKIESLLDLDTLKANFLYSEDINKNSPKLFVLPYLNVFLIYQYHYLPKKKIN